MSRNDAKAAKKRKQYFSSELGVLRALAAGISESEMFMYRKFAQAGKIFKQYMEHKAKLSCDLCVEKRLVGFGDGLLVRACERRRRK
jgi:hypothetical protein